MSFIRQLIPCLTTEEVLDPNALLPFSKPFKLTNFVLQENDELNIQKISNWIPTKLPDSTILYISKDYYSYKQECKETRLDTLVLYSTTQKLVNESLHTSGINMTTLLQNQQTI